MLTTTTSSDAFESKASEDVVVVSMCCFNPKLCHYKMRLLARAWNPYFCRGDGFPGSLVSLALRNDGIFQIPTSLKPKQSGSALVGSFARGDLFDHLDNAAPELGVGDARERAGQGQSLGGR